MKAMVRMRSALLALPLVIAKLLTGFSATASASDVLTTREAEKRVSANTIDLIDIRRPSEWRSSGIANGATPITMHDGYANFVKKIRARAKANGGRPIALICAGGVRSHRMRKALAKEGIRVLDVSGGMLGNRRGDPGWIASGFATERYTPRP